MNFRACRAVILWGAALLWIGVGCTSTGTVPPPVPYAGATPTPQGGSSPSGQSLAAQVNGTPIYLDAYQKQVAEWEAAFEAQNPNLGGEERQAMLAQGRRQVLDVMIEQVLIEQAAAAEGVSVSDAEVDKVITRDIDENGGRAEFDAWLQANHWTFQEYRERQRSMMISSRMFERITAAVPIKAEQVHARHILTATEAEARQILAQLQSGADFAVLAAQYSLDPSTRDNGGDLGFFPRGTLVVSEVEQSAFALGVGQISDVMQSAMGYHVVQVLERAQDMVLTEDSWQALKEMTFRQWVAELWAQANIQVWVS